MYQFFATIAGLCLIATIVGLIRPGIFRFKSRKAAALYGFGSMFAFQLLAMSLESDEHRQQRETEQAARQDSIVAAEKTQQAAQQPREALEASPKPKKAEQAARQDSIVAAEKTQQAAQQPREALEASPKPKKPEEAVVDSAALYQTLDRMVNKAERLISLAQAALDDNRLHEAESLTDSIEGYLKGITDNPVNTHPKNLRLRDLVFMGVKIGTHAMLRIEEAEWDSMGFFRYEKGTVERAAEVRAIRWVFGAGPVNDWRSEPVVEYSGGRKLRIVKNISVENGRLTINMHTEQYDIVKRAYSAGSVSFSHPLKLMSDFRLLCYNLWSTHPNEWSVKRFRGIKEIELVVYYPGRQSDTETPIARFGIGRKALEGANWGDIRTKDGTFQDLMKKKGTYWLHSEVPDMGTPAHLVR